MFAGVIGYGCPDGWTQHNFGCYKVFTESRNHDSALAECKLRGTRMAVVEAKEKLDFLLDFIR